MLVRTLIDSGDFSSAVYKLVIRQSNINDTLLKETINETLLSRVIKWLVPKFGIISWFVFGLNPGKCEPKKLQIRTLLTEWVLFQEMLLHTRHIPTRQRSILLKGVQGLQAFAFCVVNINDASTKLSFKRKLIKTVYAPIFKALI